MITVQNFETGAIYEWSLQKFDNKLYEIKDKLDSYDGAVDKTNENGDDPFSEGNQALIIGQAYYKLEGLAWLMDNPAVASIIGPNS